MVLDELILLDELTSKELELLCSLLETNEEELSSLELIDEEELAKELSSGFDFEVEEPQEVITNDVRTTNALRSGTFFITQLL